MKLQGLIIAQPAAAATLLVSSLSLISLEKAEQEESKQGEWDRGAIPPMDSDELALAAVIGFGGRVPAGLLLRHYQDEQDEGRVKTSMVYPLGSTIVMREMNAPAAQQSFLQGHSDNVSCLALSPSGRLLASGQVTYMGFSADIIVWDLATGTLLHRMSLHKVKVQALAFSANERYLASLGGQDDNNLVVWDVESGKAICGSPTATDFVLTVAFFRGTHTRLVTAGNGNLTVWEFDRDNRKECHLGQLKRLTHTIAIDASDEFVYAGTASGDLMQVSLKQRLFKNSGPAAPKHISQGIVSSVLLPSGDILVGGGDGTIALIPKATLKVRAETRVDSAVTSLTLTRVQTCHADRINDVAFPDGYGAVFATCSKGDIRVWHAIECKELLRIQVPNAECLCVCFSKDGSSLVSGWGDGKVRAFGPQSGKLLYAINDAHSAVTAIAATTRGDRVITGGKEGQVRVWRIGKQSQSMIASMKEHKSSVNAIHVRRNDSECVSASSDGSCIIWDLNRFARNNSVFASTFFKSILYHPDESQLLTTGTDRKITYWDAFDGQAIRVLDGSLSAALNALAISPDGVAFVSGGDDKDVRLWGYDDGVCHATGKGHSGAITKVKISPDQTRIVSVGAEGAVFIWAYPQNLQLMSAS
eukprot:jgi/Chlat1/4617/Chrsp293S00812